MSKREMTVEYLRAMVKKSFANVDIDEGCKMCFLPFQSLVDTVNLYEDKLAWQEVEIQQLTKENAELQNQVDELTMKNMGEMYDLFKSETDRLIEKAKEQTVKATAKEILQELYDQIDENTPKWVGVQIKIIEKRKGVEVE